jgi:hypothetical protein
MAVIWRIPPVVGGTLFFFKTLLYAFKLSGYPMNVIWLDGVNISSDRFVEGIFTKAIEHNTS